MRMRRAVSASPPLKPHQRPAPDGYVQKVPGDREPYYGESLRCHLEPRTAYKALDAHQRTMRDTRSQYSKSYSILSELLTGLLIVPINMALGY